MSYLSNNGNTPASSLQGNKLLATLPPTEQERLLSLFRVVDLKTRDVLFKLDEPIQYCYFPLHGVVSLTAGMNDGHTCEVGVVGCEGFAGASVIMAEDRAAHEAVVQVGPCDALRISSDDLRRVCYQNPALNQLLLRYVNALLAMTAQSSACNALHPAEERLARWLLMVQDRVESESFEITHEYLAAMIGTRRATVTETAGALQRAGIIELAVAKSESSVVPSSRIAPVNATNACSTPSTG